MFAGTRQLPRVAKHSSVISVVLASSYFKNRAGQHLRNRYDRKAFMDPVAQALSDSIVAPSNLNEPE
jgi:hypothetical protein